MVRTLFEEVVNYLGAKRRGCQKQEDSLAVD